MMRKGSSPRMRGSPLSKDMENTGYGIIPAHAGLTFSQARAINHRRDHPRACGAHLLYQAVSGCVLDHPRACGAHLCMTPPASSMLGSSPRMRGSRKAEHNSKSHCGIIPAHAGLTKGNVASHSLDEDHPRACGAHARSVEYVESVTGSSPRMRGSPPRRDRPARRVGIIPAHAGLTISNLVQEVADRDHPRACGAHCYLIDFAIKCLGSSPRMRGSQNGGGGGGYPNGIIPAHAGLTDT